MRRGDAGNEPAPTWGREADIDEVVGGLRSGPVLVEGEPGIGKTTLLRSVVDRLDDADVRWVTATEGTSDLSFGSLAVDLGPASGEDPSREFAHVVDWLVGDGRARHRLVVVDDAHWLDRRSAAALRLAAGHGIRVLLAGRTGAPLPADLASLLVDGTRVVLDGLGEAALEALAASEADGPLDPPSLVRLHDLCQGNPFFARELLLGARRAGAISVGTRGLHIDFPAIPSSLRTLIDQRLDLEPADVRAVLELTAIAQALPVEAAIDVHGAEAVECAERSTLLAPTSTDGLLRIAHPLIASALHASMASSQRRRLLRDLVLWVLADSDQRAGQDERQLARWAVEAGMEVPAQVLVRGLQRAVDQRDDELAMRLVEAVLRSTVTPEATLLCARTLHLSGRTAEALDLVSSVSVDDAADDLITARAAVEAEVRFWGIGDPASALDAVAAASSHVEDLSCVVALETARLTYALLGGQPRVVVDGLAGIEADGALGFTIASVRLPALVLRGQSDLAAPEALAVCDAPGLGGDAATERTMAEAAAAFALTEAGQFDAARTTALRAHRRSLHLGAEALEAWAALMLGRLELARGEVEEADRWFRAVVAARGEDHQGPGVRWGLAGRLLATSLAGDRVSAASLIDAIRSEEPAGRLMMEPEVEIALAHAVALTGGDPDPHLAEARRRVRASGSVGLGPAVELAAAALRRPVEAQSVPPGASPLLRARADATVLLAEGNPRPEPGPIIAALVAAGALVDAAVVAACAHRCRPASLSLEREAVRRRAAVPQVRLPLLTALDQPMLTPREHELAQLTAQGMTTAEVARVASCSVRTVENHLHRAYQKLGIAGRGDLAEALGEIPAAPSG